MGRALVEVVEAAGLPSDRNPALVYLSHLAPSGRRTMAGALETVAHLASGGRLGAVDLPWHELRYQNTQAIRAVLAERYAPATVNKVLASLRGVLKEAWARSYKC